MTVLTWGANSYGQLLLGYRCELVDLPETANFDNVIKKGESDLNNIKCIKGGGGHTLILTEAGSVYGCGLNNIAQLGTTKDGVVTKLVRLHELDDYAIKSLALGWDSCYAITEDGLCIGWGSNVYGQLGKPMEEVINSEKPVVLAEDAVQVACGARYCIILLHNGKLLSSGDYKYGQLGRKVAILDHTFTEVTDLRNIESISCGFNHTLAQHESGIFYGWGINKWGELGIDSTKCKFVAKPVQTFMNIDCNIREFHCGWSSSHLLSDDGVLINCGRNTYGQLGDGNTESHWEPIVHENTRFKKISIGSEHGLGLSEGEKLYAWGWNEHGSCGNGNTENVLKPTKLRIEYNYEKLKYFEAGVGANFIII